MNSRKNKRICIGYEGIDGFTGGFRKDDLIVFAADPHHKKEEFLWNIIRNVAEQGKKVLYISLTNETGLSYIPPKTHPNVLVKTGMASDVLGISRCCCEKRNMGFGFDLIAINCLEYIWHGPSDDRSDNISYQLKSLARNLQIPIIALSKEVNGIGRRAPVYRICNLSIQRYIDYLLMFHPPRVKNHPNNHYQDFNDGIQEIEARIVDINRDSVKIDYLIYSETDDEIREYSSHISKLIKNARSLGIDGKDATTFAFFWENKESSEENDVEESAIEKENEKDLELM